MPTLNGRACATDVQNGVDRLAGQRAAAAIGDRDRDHQRQPDALLLEDLLDGDDAGLGVERVEDRLEQQQIAAAVDQAADLLFVGVAQLVERDRAEGRVVDVGRDRQRPVGRAHRAGDEARPVRRPRRPLVAGAFREPRPFDVQLVDERLEAVVGLRDGGAAERVGLDDVAAGLEVLPVDAGDDVGPRQHEQVVVALEVARMVPRTARRGSRLPSACAAGSSSPSRRRGRGCASRAARRVVSGRQASSIISRKAMSSSLRRRVFVVSLRCGFVPDAISTVNGSPALRAPTPTSDVAQAGADQHPLQLVASSKPSARSPSFARTHSSWCARRSSTSTRPPGTVMRAASATARAPDRARGAAPATAARRRPPRP